MSRKVIPCTVKIDDVMNRFHSGDRGVLLVNDSEEYDYFVMLVKRPRRDYYFYKDEIELGEPVEAPEGEYVIVPDEGEALDQWLLTL